MYVKDVNKRCMDVKDVMYWFTRSTIGYVKLPVNETLMYLMHILKLFPVDLGEMSTSVLKRLSLGEPQTYYPSISHTPTLNVLVSCN